MRTGAAKPLFEPANTEELLRGWLLHAHKGRDRHDEAARRYQTLRFLLGVPTIALSAAVGTSVFASLNASPAAATAIAVGIVGIAATVFAALQTFLDYAGRAERHRVAAVKYKSVIRELEQALTGTLDRRDPRDEWFGELRGRLDSLEDTTPVVAQGIWERVEKTYARVDFVGTAQELTRHREAGLGREE